MDPTLLKSSSILRQSAFLRALAGQALGAIDDQLLPVAMSLYVLHNGGGINSVAFIMGARTAALVPCLLLGGLLADRFSRPKILFYADLSRSTVLFVIAATLSYLPLWGTAVAAALLAAGEAVSRPAFRSLVPQILPNELIERGNSLVSFAQRISQLAGGLIGAVAVSIIGARAVFLIASVTFLLSSLTVIGIRSKKNQQRDSSVLEDLKDAVQEIKKRPWMLAVMATISLQLLTGTAASQALLPIIARNRLGGDAAYGVVLSSFAAGSLLAVAVTSWWRPRNVGRVAIVTLVSFSAEPFSLALSAPLWVVMAGFAVAGFAVEFFFVYWISALQRNIPELVLGKVLALDQLAAFAFLPLGYALVPICVKAIGASGTLWSAGVLVMLSSALCLLAPGVKQFADPSARHIRA